EQVTVRTVARAGGSLAPKGQVVVGRHTCRDFYRDGPLAPHPSIAPAHLAGLEYDHSVAAAGGTGRHRHELPEHAAGRAAHLPARVVQPGGWVRGRAPCPPLSSPPSSVFSFPLFLVPVAPPARVSLRVPLIPCPRRDSA